MVCWVWLTSGSPLPMAGAQPGPFPSPLNLRVRSVECGEWTVSEQQRLECRRLREQP